MTSPEFNQQEEELCLKFRDVDERVAHAFARAKPDTPEFSRLEEKKFIKTRNNGSVFYPKMDELIQKKIVQME